MSISEDELKERTVSITSSYDGISQKVAFIQIENKSRPLVVALHTWGYDYTQDSRNEYFKHCAEREWNCIFPDFRGRNNRPEACGSEAALTDILDAVQWAKSVFTIDPRRVFLAGASGGGHMALNAAGHAPSVWTAVSVWSPISDCARWHRETIERGLLYASDLEKACGGAPGTSRDIDSEYAKRSPLTSLWRAHIIPIDINNGIHDGHTGLGGEGSVPVGHSIRAYNELVTATGKSKKMISEDVIDYIEREEHIPEKYHTGNCADSTFSRRIYLRRTSGLTRLTLFDGGNEILYDEAFRWFDRF
ncbi:alpha/beta hydrolase family protein [Candidatus Latescibacterota bacterium]